MKLLPGSVWELLCSGVVSKTMHGGLAILHLAVCLVLGMPATGNSGEMAAEGSSRLAKPSRPVHRAQGVKVDVGPITLRGGLDKEIIRRIVRYHVDEVKGCYEDGLAQKPGLEGRVTIKFTVSVTGEVVSPKVASSTLGNSRVESCVVKAMHGWEFPRSMCGCESLVSVAFDFSTTKGEARTSNLAGNHLG